MRGNEEKEKRKREKMKREDEDGWSCMACWSVSSTSEPREFLDLLLVLMSAAHYRPRMRTLRD